MADARDEVRNRQQQTKNIAKIRSIMDAVTGENDLPSLHNMLVEAEKVAENATCAPEIIADVRIALEVATQGLKIAKEIETQFDSVALPDFLNSLVVCLSSNLDHGSRSKKSMTELVQKKWTEVGRIATPLVARSPKLPFIFSEKPPERKKPAPRTTPASNMAPIVSVSGPKQQANGGDQQPDSNEMKKRTGYITQKLKEFGKISFPRFVVDPSSYVNTVENMFHLSFLIRQGVAELVVEDDESFLVSKVEVHRANMNQGNLNFKQIIIRLDYETWEEMSARYPERILNPWEPSEEYLRQIGLSKQQFKNITDHLSPVSKYDKIHQMEQNARQRREPSPENPRKKRPLGVSASASASTVAVAAVGKSSRKRKPIESSEEDDEEEDDENI